MLRQLRSSPFLIVVLFFVVLWFFIRPAAAESRKGVGFPDFKFSQTQALVNGAAHQLFGVREEEEPVRAELRAGWIGFKNKDQLFSNIYVKTDSSAEVVFCGSSLDCENYEQVGLEVKCLASNQPPRTLNTGMIQKADEIEIDLAKLGAKTKVQICNGYSRELNDIGVPVNPGGFGKPCTLDGYEFPKACGEIFISTEGVECYMYRAKVGPTLPSRFSLYTVINALKVQFANRPSIKLSELIKVNQCSRSERPVLVKDFEVLRASAIDPRVPVNTMVSADNTAR